MSETAQADSASDTAAAPDPVRRWTYIVAGLLLALLAYNIAADRLAPITYQTTAETLVVPVTPQVSGEILSVPVTDNSRVTKGQLLAVIDPTNYRIALESARASYGAAQQSVGAAAAAVDSARAVLTSRKAQLIEAQQDNDRTAKLLAVGYATRAKLEATMATLASAEAGVLQAEAGLAGALQQLGPIGSANPQLRAAVAALDAAQKNLEWTKVVAPVDGYISNLQIGRGSYASAGTPLVSLIDVSRGGLIGYFSENQLGNVRLGDPALIALDMFPGQLFHGPQQAVDPAKLRPALPDPVPGRQEPGEGPLVDRFNLGPQRGQPEPVVFGRLPQLFLKLPECLICLLNTGIFS